MEGSITWVGIDAHKKTLAVAVLGAHAKPEEFTVENDERSIRKLAKRLTRNGNEVRCCYEAGPCGYALQRRLEAAGVVCEVIAPSLIPRKPGDRIKTDKRDALKLAELQRAGVLTTVSPPTEEQEAVRDLCRCREAARADLHRCRHRLLKMLVRRGLVFKETSRMWSKTHRHWIDSLTFENDTDRVVFDEYRLAIDQVERRLKALDGEIEKAAQLPLYREHAAWLRCFRGVDTTNAMLFLGELHGIERFQSPRELAAYLGLVPSLYASGDSSRRGPITKAGNGHIRRALVQTAWQYFKPIRHARAQKARQEGQPACVIAVAEEAQRRLTKRARRLLERRKHANKVVIAIARELVGFFWAALRAGRESARHGGRTSAQFERAKAIAAPRSSPTVTVRKVSRAAVGQRREARKEKRAS
jgi:transposase